LGELKPGARVPNGAVADPRKAVSSNVEGEFFVDRTCIDCDTCRQLAPDTFGDEGDHAFVKQQPRAPAQVRAALRALIACPTGSIGTRGPNEASSVRDDFPMHVVGPVSYLGYTSADSFGGSSYLIEHPEGNWMIDSPKFNRHLVERIEDRGGIARIFLTHQDDVADAERYAAWFGAQRMIHRRDVYAQREAEIVIEGTDAVEASSGFTVIPTPGHTAGHCALLFTPSGGDSCLFSGDHVWWSRNKERLWASREVCWHDWKEQTASVEKLVRYDIDWILPGHGERRHLGRERTREELERLARDMRA
jgi:glyoxylase-like metal-dependent hydrolase (beta-lactamase superfamily II)/ferredoxin